MKLKNQKMKLLLSATGAPLRVRAACRRHNKIILLISNAEYFRFSKWIWV